MLTVIRSAAVLGVHAYEVAVEVDVAMGLPQFTIVGLPFGAVKESRDRVVTALAHAGCPVPPRRITVNLAPAGIRKDGTGFDLPIALGILASLGLVPGESLDGLAAIGELALDGALRPVRGALPVAGWAAGAGVTLVVPPGNAHEAARVRHARLTAPASLADLVADLRGGRRPPPAVDLRVGPAAAPLDDFADVVGQDAAKRALEIAAAGAHNVLLIGPPGAGKTMLARRLPSILPTLDDDEALEVLTIRSVAGLPVDRAEPARPFRAPHHTISCAGLVGGGSTPRPGEVTLAHRGVLFLDELLEFPRHVLDALRQPMEDGCVLIARAAGALAYPARFTLVAATNPCPCGRAGEGTGAAGACACSPADVARYQARLSGPLADRIDMHIRVGALPPRAIGAAPTGEPSADIRERVERARATQRARGTVPPDAPRTAHAGRALVGPAHLTPAARGLLATAAERLALSARAYFRVARVARTIADLDGLPRAGPEQVAEALRFRPATATPAPSAASARG